MTTSSARARRRQRGQGLVELAFFVPVIALFFVALIDLAHVRQRKLQVTAAFDAVANWITNQARPFCAAGDTDCVPNDEIAAFGCRALEDMGVLQDLHATEADCRDNGWIRVDPAQADPSSGMNAKVYPVTVSVPVPALFPGLTLPLGHSVEYHHRSSYLVSTGTQYVRASLLVSR